MSEASDISRGLWRTIGGVLVGRTKLWRVLCLAVVPAAALLWLILLAAVRWRAPDGVFYVWLSLVVVWMLWAPLVIWRSAGSTPRLVRYPSRLAAIALPASLLFLALTPHYDDYTPFAKLQEAVNRSNPHRVSLAIACDEGVLNADIADPHEVLGLETPTEYAGTYTRSITASITGADTAEVKIVLETISDELRGGQAVVYEGRCENGEMHWRVTGDIPETYRARLDRLVP